jgi:hypothetical protein
MPEFCLNENAPTGRWIGQRRRHAFYDLSTFARGFVESCFFMNGDDDSESQGENSLNNLGTARLTRDACNRIAKYCDAFESTFAPLLRLAYGEGLDDKALRERDSYDESSAGRDLWFTSKGQGVGFWDRAALNVDLNAIEGGAAAWAKALESCPAIAANLYALDGTPTLGDALSACAEAFTSELNVTSYRGWINVY